MSTLKRTGELRRTELVRRTPLRAKTPLSSRLVLLRAAPRVKRYRSTGPVRGVVDLVYERDGGCCIRCGKAFGPRSTHHRRPRRAGGDRRPDTNSPANLITLCGSGTSNCHGWIEQHRADARRWGWLLASNDEPSAVPLSTWWGPVLLDHEGRWSHPEQCPECRCDPVLCETDDSGEHCSDQSCPTCLHGCPLPDGECPVCGVAR